MGILSSPKRNNRHPARSSYTSSQRRVPSSEGGLFFAHVKSTLSWTLDLRLGMALLVRLGVNGFQLYRMATTSELFAIKRVEIRGTTHFSREEVLKAANLQLGVNSLTVNITDVEQGLRDSLWVLFMAAKRYLPDAFEIRIRERIPAFWTLKDDALYYANNRGRTIAPMNVGNFLSLPTPEILPDGEELLPQMDEFSRAFQAAHLPVSMASVSLFRVSVVKGFEVFIENRNLVLCIAAEGQDANLRRLSLVLSDLTRRGELKTTRGVWVADGNVWVVEPENV